MAEQKRFQKKELNKDDYKCVENGAKATKGILASAGAIALVVFNKNNLKEVVTLVKTIVKR